MRFLEGGVLLFLVACSSGNPQNDAGTDASNGNDSSVTDSGQDSGSCPASAATLTGTLLGNTMAVKDAMSTSDSNGSFVVLTDFANVCAIGPNNLKANSSTLLFSLLSGATSFAVKTYNVPVDVDVAYATWDATCGSPNGESSTGGTVTITKADACGVVGTFDVTLNTDHVTGSFTAPACAPAAADAGNGCK
jgi:hypothetical protein